ncbi:MAG TPA: alpha/beta fold hydrolase [Patescibacteria group bacterium]|nr:alpha/beta fold hydrolase [Patescibacteria group bacterium]
MPMNPDLDPSAFFLEGGQTGVLLIHGFTGAPTEMRLIGDYFHDRGLTIFAPLLPGHGTTADDLNHYRWIDWFDHAKWALGELQNKCEIVFIAGLSMGAVLTLSLAATQPDIQGIISYAAAIQVNDRRRYLPTFVGRIIRQAPKSKEYWADPNAESLCWSYDSFPSMAASSFLKQLPDITAQLSQVTCPYLAIYSTADSSANASGVRLAYERVSSTDKELIEIQDSGHVITLDRSWERVAEKSFHFIKQHLPEGEFDGEKQ